VTSLNVVSPDVEDLFFGPVARCADFERASSLGELRRVLERRLAASPTPRTLDLIGHSTRDHNLLRLGDTAVDMLDLGVARFFRDLAAEGLLPRLGITAVRLLACETAVTAAGRRTLRLLARTLALPVFGTTRPLMKSHYDRYGFAPAFAAVLVEASNLG